MSYVHPINVINQQEKHQEIRLTMDILCLTIQRDQLQRNLTQNSKEFLKSFDLRPKDLREASINSMPLKSLVIDTKKNEERKTVKINKKSSIVSNNQDSQTRKSKRLKKR